MPGPVPLPQTPAAPRLLRLWRWRRNPLRRPSDLLQAWTGLLLSVAVLVMVPVTVLLVGDAVHRSLHKSAHEQSRSGHRTTAVLLRDAPQHPEPGSEESEHVRYPAKVRFPGPDGTTRTAIADVRPGAVAGSTVRVWSNAGGKLTDPPLTGSEIHDRVVGWAAGAGAAVAVAGPALYAATARVLERRRMAAWGRAWAETAPRWTTST